MAIRELTLSGMGVPPYSIRGVTQSVEIIDSATHVRRTVNGTLLNLGDEAFQKYASEISCEDVDVPAIDGIMPGMIVDVGCIFELCYQGALPLAGNNTRPAVADSAREANGFVFYRPVLTMMVLGVSMEHDEWGRVTSWQISLEEV